MSNMKLEIGAIAFGCFFPVGFWVLAEQKPNFLDAYIIFGLAIFAVFFIAIVIKFFKAVR